MLGSPVDLSKVDCDSYVIAGIADHLCPWQSCYRTTQLLGGPVTFVLSTSGHIASMVNPPGNPKATFQTGPQNPPDPRDWLADASTASGSWWPHYSQWLADHSGAKRKARIRLGRPGYEVLCRRSGDLCSRPIACAPSRSAGSPSGSSVRPGLAGQAGGPPGAAARSSTASARAWNC